MSTENILSACVQAGMNCDKIIQISYEVLQGTLERSNLSQAKGMAKTQEQGFSEDGNISHKNYS
jgi:hypothetical protein